VFQLAVLGTEGVADESCVSDTREIPEEIERDPCGRENGLPSLLTAAHGRLHDIGMTLRSAGVDPIRGVFPPEMSKFPGSLENPVGPDPRGWVF